MDGSGWGQLPMTLGARSHRPLLVRCAEAIHAGWCVCFPFVNIGLFVVDYLIFGQWAVSVFLASIFLGPIVRYFISARAKLTRSQFDEPLIPINWKLIVFLWLPAQIGFIVWALSTIASDGGVPAVLGLAMPVGLLGGSIGAAIAHDLVHSRDPLDHVLAEMLMALTSYPQFCTIHLRRHHIQFGTIADRGTASRGENIYVFCARAIVGNFTDGWRANAADTHRGNEKRGNGRGRILHYALALGLIYLAVFMYAGGAGVVFFFSQSLVGIFVIEGLNFVQHYGLGHGTKTEHGRSETAGRAWNVRYSRSNWLMVRLGRHSEHHLEHGSMRRRPAAFLAELPQLPAGYWTMFVIALLPPLWRKIMDPRVAQICSRRIGHQEEHL